jgi:hypothetical protein
LYDALFKSLSAQSLKTGSQSAGALFGLKDPYGNRTATFAQLSATSRVGATATSSVVDGNVCFQAAAEFHLNGRHRGAKET